jgi:iron complex outermembrane receptor protein
MTAASQTSRSPGRCESHRSISLAAIRPDRFFLVDPASPAQTPPGLKLQPRLRRRDAAGKSMTPPLCSPRGVRLYVFAVVLFAIPAFCFAQVAATGAIEGRVSDSRRGEFLENARLTIDGSTQEVFTDATGQYRMSGVPAGTVTLKIFYTGLGVHSEIVTVAPGQTVQRDIALAGAREGKAAAANDPAVKLDSFVVSSSKEMEGAAIAINEQRFAKNVMNVVSADEFGTIADGSVGEFMKFLPGITSDYTGGDARRFSINGVPAGNVPISMGGFDMASASGAGTARAVELDQVSINSVSRVEINRSPVPETPGSALAGSVNFVPKSAFERNRPVYTYSLAFLMKDAERAFLRQTPGPGWGQKTYKIHPGFDVSAVVPVTKNFGFAVSAGYSLQYTPQSNSAMQWRGAAVATTVASNLNTGYPDTTPDKPYLTNYSTRDSGKDTTRYSFATTIDWRFARYDRVSLGFSYAFLNEHFATRTTNYIINRVAPGAWDATHTQGVTSSFTAASNINAGQIEIVNNGRIRPGRTIMPTLVWRHDGPIWKSDTGISYSTSRIHYLDIDKGFFNSVIARRTNVTIRYDDIFYLRPGNITVTDPNGAVVDPNQLNSYSIVSANSVRQITYDTKRQAYANLRRDLYIHDKPVSLKIGADVRTQVRDRRGISAGETYNYIGADGRASTTPATTAGAPNDDAPTPYFDVPYSARVPDFGFPPRQQIDNNKLWDAYKAHPNYFSSIDTTGNYTNWINGSNRAQEIISSAYFRGDVAFFNNRLKFVAGVRAEQTNIDAEGAETDPTRNFQRDASGKFIRGANGQPLAITSDALAALKLTLVDRGFHAKKEYLRLFPSLNASYNVSENLILRGAYYETVGRPDFAQYVGGLTLPNTELANSTSNRITVSNVNIKAWQARSYIARLEYYFGNVGQVSFGAFIRDYKNFFSGVVSRVSPEFLAAYSLDPDIYGDYDVSTQFNLPGNIRMTGLEFDYKQALTFLPQWARGVSFFVNASSQRAKDTDNFQDMNPFVCNWGLSLSRQKFNIRINENYRGLQRRGAITGRSLEPGTYNYRPKRLYIDVSAEYYYRRSLGFFVALRNLNDATEDQKVYGPNTPKYATFRQRDDYAALWTAGVKGSF